jgi:hypothetical protein
MKICFVVNEIPNNFSGGGAVTAFNTIKTLRQLGHWVAAILLVEKEPEPQDQRLQQLKAVSDVVYFVLKQYFQFSLWQKIKAKFLFSLEQFFPEVFLREQVAMALNQEQPDVVVIYDFGPLAATYGLTKFPKMAIMGDPPFSVLKYRFWFLFDSFSWKKLWLAPLAPLLYWQFRKACCLILKECQARGAFANHHAKELQALGCGPVQYYRTPTTDFLNNSQEIFQRPAEAPSKFRILLLGHLKGISTLSGIALLAKEILPILEQRIGREHLEVLIVGRYFDELPKTLKQKLTKPFVKTLEFAPVLSQVMLEADVFLVPTPIKLGIRVRIISGLSFGCCLVAHRSNQQGIPELQDGINCLLADSGLGLAEKIVACWQGVYNIKELKKCARQTFERYFERFKSVGGINKTLLRIVKKV